MRTAHALLLSAALAFGACASPDETEPPPVLTATEFGEMPNTHALGDILTGGQLTRADLQLAKQRGVRTVVTLRTPGEVEWDEHLVASDLGLTFVEIPFRAPEDLTDDVFEQGRLTLENAERPMIMHCGSANRVGALWLPWRVLDGGLDVEAALAEAKQVGLRTPAYEERALAYITRMQAAD